MRPFGFDVKPGARVVLDRAYNDLQADFCRSHDKVMKPVSARYRRIIYRPGGLSRDRALAHIASSAKDHALADLVESRLQAYSRWKRMCVLAVQYERVRAEVGVEGVLWFREKLAGERQKEGHDILLHFLAAAKPGVPLQRTLRAYRRTIGGNLTVALSNKPPGRKPIGHRAMTAAERQQRHREKGTQR